MPSDVALGAASGPEASGKKRWQVSCCHASPVSLILISWALQSCTQHFQFTSFQLIQMRLSVFEAHQDGPQNKHPKFLVYNNFLMILN